jgi:gliding motility-associated-like protein
MKAYYLFFCILISWQITWANPTDTLLFPQNNAVQVPANVRLQIYFNEPIQRGAGNIEIFDATTNTQIFSIPVTCSCISTTNNKVCITLPALLSAGQTIFVRMPNGIFKNNLNQPFEGFNSSSSWRFTIAGGLITHQNFIPANNSTCVPLAQNTFQIVLSSAAYSSTNGWIRIFEKNTQRLHEAIRVPSVQVIANSSNIVSFVISQPLKPATDYYVLIEPTSFLGSGNFVYEGIYDENVWTFRTSENKPNTQNTEICGAGLVLLKADYLNNDVQFRWYNTATGGEPIRNSNGQIANTDTLRIFVQNSKMFYVAVWKNGCESARTPLAVNVKPLPASTLPPEEIRVGRGVKVNLEANGGVKYLWQPSTGLSNPTISNPELLTQENITYTVTIENEQGCSIQKRVNIIVDDGEKDFFLPTIFSPNNDGIHDFFRIKGKNILELEWSIYDRNGKLLYRTAQVQEALNSGWDGTFNNTPQPQDTYIWTLKGKFSDGSPLPQKAGSVLLIR